MRPTRQTARRSFKDIVEASRPECRALLAEKAHLANRIAKTLPPGTSRQAAYSVKRAALEQGIRCHGFRLIGDDQARPELVLVRTGTHGSLHLRIDQLSRDILARPDIRLRIRGMAA